ncbi:doxx family protein [Confluentibacter flavum]|uniref:Doxx family protein n=1 Tax=Confluentibacter flavum TaxID=1909700 RepID=A0A2N3HHI1_9FLAO|nr:doxx family protein [Confluentibacter flavum]PKQ44411.1 doxx family protein [Confluentibacter flavum]
MTRILLNIDRGRLLAISIGIIYFWFGLLKFFPELSPADGLAKHTITFLTFGLIPENISILMLAIIEVGIGLCLLFNVQLKTVVSIAIIHLILTFIPVLFFPEVSFAKAPFVLTLVGQYIVKNIVIISALFFIYPINDYTKHLIK